MRMFGFNAPHVKMSPKFWTAQMGYSHANVGRFVRNCVLDGKTYGTSDLVPSYLKTADLVHPLCGSYNSVGEPLGVYGGVTASAGVNNVLAIIQHERPDAWAPGGNGINHWFAIKLAEPDLADRYHVNTKSAEAPLSWKLQGSIDGDAWTDIHVVDSTGVWASGGETKEFLIPEESRGNFLWYKLLITGSNATTMRIYRFRLLRPVSVCPRNHVLLDASAGNPLVLSFADGFSGGSPVDHIETITSPQIIPIADDDDLIPSSGGSFDLYAVRSPSGGVTIEPVYYGGAEVEILSGGMQSYMDREFQVTPASGSSYMYWGRTSVPTPQPSTGVRDLSRISGNSFYVSRVIFGRFGSSGVAYINLDTGGGYVRFATPTDSIPNYSLPVGFAVYGVQCDFKHYQLGARIFTAGSRYRHRMVGGVLYQWDNNDPGATWTPVQKIKLATVRQVSGLTDVANVIPKATALSMWQINGDETQTLIEG
jgi:hypothetical protein